MTLTCSSEGWSDSRWFNISGGFTFQSIFGKTCLSVFSFLFSPSPQLLFDAWGQCKHRKWWAIRGQSQTKTRSFSWECPVCFQLHSRISSFSQTKLVGTCCSLCFSGLRCTSQSPHKTTDTHPERQPKEGLCLQRSHVGLFLKEKDWKHTQAFNKEPTRDWRIKKLPQDSLTVCEVKRMLFWLCCHCPRGFGETVKCVFFIQICSNVWTHSHVWTQSERNYVRVVAQPRYLLIRVFLFSCCKTQLMYCSCYQMMTCTIFCWFLPCKLLKTA